MKNILDGMKRIETKEDMIKWATAINNGPMSAQDKCDYQDVWAHSERNTLDRLFIEANGSRNIIVCSVHNTMAYDELEHLLKVWAADKANKIINEEIERLTTDHMKRDKELSRKEAAFEEGKRTIYRKIKGLKRDSERLTRLNTDLLKRIEEYRNETFAANRHANEYERKANKYDAIKEALAE